MAEAVVRNEDHRHADICHSKKYLAHQDIRLLALCQELQLVDCYQTATPAINPTSAPVREIFCPGKLYAASLAFGRDPFDRTQRATHGLLRLVMPAFAPSACASLPLLPEAPSSWCASDDPRREFLSQNSSPWPP